MWRIIILEDSQRLFRQWKNALNHEGFLVEEAVNGRHLFEILTEKEVNMIILDLFLTSEHGFHIIRRLKEHPDYKKIPIIVASPERRRESIEEVINAGVVDYLIKPMPTDFLVKRVKRVYEVLNSA